MTVTVAAEAREVPAPVARTRAMDAMWPLWCALGSSLAAAFGVHVGGVGMLAGALDRRDGGRRRTLEMLVIVVGGDMLVGWLTLFMEKTVRPFMHRGSFYLLIGATAVPILAAVRGATGRRWA